MRFHTIDDAFAIKCYLFCVVVILNVPVVCKTIVRMPIVKMIRHVIFVNWTVSRNGGAGNPSKNVRYFNYTISHAFFGIVIGWVTTWPSSTNARLFRPVTSCHVIDDDICINPHSIVFARFNLRKYTRSDYFHNYTVAAGITIFINWSSFPERVSNL